MEYWISEFSSPSAMGELAARAEQEGWDGLTVGDSPGRGPDSFLQIYAAVSATRLLKIGTGVTHPALRLAAVLANLVATLQLESGGRMILGLGRGDSAHAFLGMAPAPLDVFEQFVLRVAAYLRGEAVDDSPSEGQGLIPALTARGGTHEPMSNSLQWLPDNVTTVPIDVAASGPRMMELGCRIADRVTLSVGAEPERIARAQAIVERKSEEAGRDAPPTIGAYVPFAVHPDGDVAREQVRATVASFAQKSGSLGLRDKTDNAVDSALYSRLRHDLGHARNAHAGRTSTSEMIPADFVRRFAIAGTAEECGKQLEPLGELGLDRVVLVSAPETSRERLLEIPALQEPHRQERARLYRLLASES